MLRTYLIPKENRIVPSLLYLHLGKALDDFIYSALVTIKLVIPLNKLQSMLSHHVSRSKCVLYKRKKFNKSCLIGR